MTRAVERYKRSAERNNVEGAVIRQRLHEQFEGLFSRFYFLSSHRPALVDDTNILSPDAFHIHFKTFVHLFVLKSFLNRKVVELRDPVNSQDFGSIRLAEVSRRFVKLLGRVEKLEMLVDLLSGLQLHHYLSAFIVFLIDVDVVGG